MKAVKKYKELEESYVQYCTWCMRCRRSEGEMNMLKAGGMGTGIVLAHGNEIRGGKERV